MVGVMEGRGVTPGGGYASGQNLRQPEVSRQPQIRAGTDKFAMVTHPFAPYDERFMRLALAEAAGALEHDDVPVGAVLVRGGEVVGAGHNERERLQDPSAHAEML